MVKLPIVGQLLSFVRGPQKGERGGVPSKEERLRIGFDGAPVGIAFASLDGHWLQVNEHFRSRIGYTREELSRISFHSITHPDDAKRETALVKKLIAGDIENYRLEKRVMEKKGRYRTVEVLATLVRKAGGEPEFFVYIIDEVPYRKTHVTQDAPVAEHLTDIAVIHTDEKGVIEGWNPGAERIFGYSAEQMIGRNRRQLFRDPESWEGKSTRQMKAVKDEAQIDVEDWRVAKDGRHLWVRTTLAPVRVDGLTKGYVEIIKPPAPVDPHKALEATIETLRLQLDTAQRKEESLRHALDEVRVMGEQTMEELRIMAVALRKEIDRRKELELQLAEVPAVEEEFVTVIDLPPSMDLLDGTASELLLRIAGEQRTGTLGLTTSERQLEVFFDKGRVYSTASNDPSTFLAQRLIDAGILTDHDRARALELRQYTNLALGRILLILGVVTEEQLLETMRRKIELEVREALSWKDVRWAFVEGEVPSLQLVPVRSDVQLMLAPPPAFVASPSPKSKKFHTADCVSVRRIDPATRLVFADAAAAEAKGYEACRICVGTAEKKP
ncbi:MAG: PAS domain S-box protein [Acidobacteria bacterium]|nr:PAS domain S-box protein [Acidobacteriota bacterium]